MLKFHPSTLTHFTRDLLRQRAFSCHAASMWRAKDAISVVLVPRHF